ncbi:hypothetical protein BV20DRAFT_1111970 [Pilatotrama ljubarskyi]|nr:hypothetical protein BV20DRAFT_1111970 [Pilatotrama ljubarskyi]
MSSPVRALAPVALPASRGTNTKKRALADSDAEQRDVKRAKPEDDPSAIELRKDTKEKKKRRKKKRKVPLVHAPDLEERVAPKASGSRSRSRSVSAAGSSKVDLEGKEHPDQVSVAALLPVDLPPAAPREASPSLSSSSKGKGRATPDDVATQAIQQQITDLKDQVSAKATLVSQHETLLSTFQQSLSCQICLDLMHKPFALAPCGHSACYDCLVNWFKAPPPDVPAHDVLPVWLRKKTCPHCRTVVKERPIEIWTIKEMVASLVKSGLGQALLPAPAPAADAPANADPWSGIFRPANGNHGVFPGGQRPELLQQLMGLRDDEDGGIYRCIDCHHEIWDGACSECGRVYPGHDPHGHDADEFDEEDGFGHWANPALDWDYDDDDEEDDEIDDIGPWNPLDMFRQIFLPAPRDDLDGGGSDGGSSSVESRYGDEDIDLEAEAVVLEEARPVNRGRIEHVLDDEEDGEDEEEGYESSFIDDGDNVPGSRHLPRVRRRAPSVDLDRDEVIALSEDDGGEDEGEDDEEVQFVGFGRRRPPLPAPRGRGRGAVVITSDEEEEEYGVSEAGSGSEGYGSHDDNSGLAAEVAARERELYGDDGSVQRHAAHFDVGCSDEDDGGLDEDEDDEYGY